MSDKISRLRNGLRLDARTERLILALLCALLLGQLLFSVRQLSLTQDESIHLYSGYRYLTCGDLTVSPEHPPLAKIVAAAPLLRLDFAETCAPFKGSSEELATACVTWLGRHDWRSALTRARIAVSVFALGLCLLVWIAARRMFDLATAVTATVLLVFEPNLLAYGALVMTDVPVACLLPLAVYGFYRWGRNRTALLFLLTGVATGLTLLAKHSGVVVIPILGVLAVVDAWFDPAGPRSKVRAVVRNLLAVMAICAVAVCIVWLGYGMRFSAYPGSVQFQGIAQGAAAGSPRLLLALKTYRLLPEAYLEGLAGALSISSQSAPTFLAGEIRSRSPWFSALFQMLIRNTPAVLALFVLAAVGTLAAFRQRPREVLFLLIPAGLFLAACLYSGNISVRYLLPLFPFLLIVIAAGCVHLARRARWIRYAVPGLILLHVASSLHAYPNYLSYANELLGGPGNAYKHVPWVDMGQAYPQAKAYLEEHPAESCWLITEGRWDPRLYGVPCQPFGTYLPNPIPPRVQGTVIVSSNLFSSADLHAETAAPFKNIAPNGRIGGSALLVYDGDFDTRGAAALSERLLMAAAFSAGKLSEAWAHGQRSVELVPDSALARGALCLLLAEIGPVDPALEECYKAESLFLRDPLREHPTHKKFLDSIKSTAALLRERYRAFYGRDAPSAPSGPASDAR